MLKPFRVPQVFPVDAYKCYIYLRLSNKIRPLIPKNKVLFVFEKKKFKFYAQVQDSFSRNYETKVDEANEYTRSRHKGNRAGGNIKMRNFIL